VVTEQVKRMQVALRECGFKRGEFQVRAEARRKTDRYGSGRRYTEFGPAHAITAWRAGDEVVARAFEKRQEIAAKGYGVCVYEGDGRVAMITVHDLRYQEEPYIVRRAHADGQYREKVDVAVGE
jgi:hypothetical protein